MFLANPICEEDLSIRASISRLTLIRDFIEELPSPRSAGHTEGALRSLCIYEALCLWEPLCWIGNAISGERTSQVPIDSVSNRLDWHALQELDDGTIVGMMAQYWWETSVPDLSEHSVWLVRELPEVVDRLRTDLSTALGDPVVEKEAAKGIVRLHAEGLWTQHQWFWKKVSTVAEVSDYVTREDGSVFERETCRRDFQEFMSACPPIPVDADRSGAAEFIRNELSLQPQDAGLRRALEILYAVLRAGRDLTS